MKYSTPEKLIATLIEARNSGGVESVVSLYEIDATIVPQPGTTRSGAAALREWLASFAALKPTFEVLGREIIEARGLAIHYSHWTLKGTDPSGNPLDLSGRSTDILRKQQNGNWLVAVDNPWGAAVLDKPAA